MSQYQPKPNDFIFYNKENSYIEYYLINSIDVKSNTINFQSYMINSCGIREWKKYSFCSLDHFIRWINKFIEYITICQ